MHGGLVAERQASISRTSGTTRVAYTRTIVERARAEPVLGLVVPDMPRPGSPKQNTLVLVTGIESSRVQPTRVGVERSPGEVVHTDLRAGRRQAGAGHERPQRGRLV